MVELDERRSCAAQKDHPQQFARRPEQTGFDWESEAAESLVLSVGSTRKRRAETLSVEEIARLADAITARRA